MQHLSVAIVINPHASRAKGVAEEMEAEAETCGLRVVSCVSLADKELKDALNESIEKKPDCIVIGGGDGTIRFAVEYLLERGIPLALLALGTTNNFARSLGIPLDWKEALRLVTNHEPEPVYVGEVNGHVFCNTATIGVSSRVAHDVTKEQKKLLGRAAYAIASVRLLFKHPPFRCVITNAQDRKECRTFQVVVTNGGFHSGKPVSSTTATERRLSLAVFGKDWSRWHHAKSFYAFLRGKHKGDPDTLLLDGPRFSVTAHPAQHVELDGEVLARTPAEFRIAERQIAMFLPPESERMHPDI